MIFTVVLELPNEFGGRGQKQYFLKRNFSNKVEALHFQLNNNEKSNLANLEFNSHF
jgi:hypothetical protein